MSSKVVAVVFVGKNEVNPVPGAVGFRTHLSVSLTFSQVLKIVVSSSEAPYWEKFSESSREGHVCVCYMNGRDSDRLFVVASQSPCPLLPDVSHCYSWKSQGSSGIPEGWLSRSEST